MNGEGCNVAVLASGRGSNFKAIVEAARQENFPAKVCCFITDNPKAPALEFARSSGIDSYTFEVTEGKGKLPVEVEEKIAATCKEHGADLIVLAGFMRILKGALLDEFEGRIMNIHPSLLPSFKGLDSARRAFDYGVKITGCTVHFVDRSIDGGAIILQAAVTIETDDITETLLSKIHQQEHRIYPKAIELFALGKLKEDGRRVLILE